ncbi:MAG: CHAD domain-containing protein [Alphaproteobacteria bacterium]|nr:CHAD domain-containing protein [Alphaproteobacteria bacterium]
MPSLALRPDEAPAAGVRRVALDALDDAFAHLRGTSELDPDRQIHEARKRMKELRALAVLLRPTLGKAAAKEQGAAFRDTAKPLAGLRDAHVMRGVVGALAAQVPEASAEIFEAALGHHEEPDDPGEARAAALATLEAVAPAVGTWGRDAPGWDGIGVGLERLYAACRRDLAIVALGGSGEQFHDWRKAVKYLMFALRLLEPAWPELQQPYERALDRLAELLGDEHDLGVLIETLDATLAAHSGAPWHLALRQAARARALALRAEALALGSRIFAEQPRAFIRRQQRYWVVWTTST